MASRRRCGHPTPGALPHADHGAPDPSGAAEPRLRQAGLRGSTGSVGATLHTERLDRRAWATRDHLATTVFAFIEGFDNPRRRHSPLGYLSSADHQTTTATTPASTA